MKRYILCVLAIPLASIIVAGNADVGFPADLYVDIPDAGVEVLGHECNQLKWRGSECKIRGVDIGADGPHMQELLTVAENQYRISQED